MMTPEDQEARENGIRLLNQMSGSIFSYELLVAVPEHELKCGNCYGPAAYVENMKHDAQYSRFVCTPCRDKLIWQSYKRWVKKHGGSVKNESSI